MWTLQDRAVQQKRPVFLDFLLCCCLCLWRYSIKWIFKWWWRELLPSATFTGFSLFHLSWIRIMNSHHMPAAEPQQSNQIGNVHNPQTRTQRSDLSIGVMMKGMVERPMAVVVHLRTGRGHLVVLPSRCSDAAHTRLMVKPGMITEAKACHTKVSTTATATRVVFPGLSPWALRNRWMTIEGRFSKHTKSTNLHTSFDALMMLNRQRD